MNLNQIIFEGCVFLSLFSCVKKDEAKIIKSPSFEEFQIYQQKNSAVIKIITSADMDGDGKKEILVGSYDHSTDQIKVDIYENNGKGSFTLRPQREYRK